jgi:hypothetical protein
MNLPRPRAHVLAVVLLALGGGGVAAEGTSATVITGAPTTTTPTTGKAPTPPPARANCGPAAAAELGHSVGEVATRIYGAELSSSETESDQRQVEGYGPLLSAVAGGSTGAIEAAVTSLVYSHTHIVRLRITRGSTILADVGGPYILAPVGGSLRLNGRTIAHYVLSVQDDLGYVKLVTRFLGVPLTMRVGSRQLPVEGLLPLGPAEIPAEGPLTFRHVHYEAFSFNARSFPGGPLRISLLAPLSPSLSAESCPEIKSTELGRAAQLISQQFSLSHESFPGYIRLVSTLTHGQLYIRSGSQQLAGSTPTGPRSLPNTGTIRYHRRTYEVYSFIAPSTLGQLRIYQLVSP